MYSYLVTQNALGSLLLAFEEDMEDDPHCPPKKNGGNYILLMSVLGSKQDYPMVICKKIHTLPKAIMDEVHRPVSWRTVFQRGTEHVHVLEGCNSPAIQRAR